MTRIKNFVLFFVQVITTLSFLSIPVFAIELKPWTGTYREANGVHDLIIDEWEPGQLSVHIVKAGKSAESWKNVDAGFLAEVKGEVATWSSISFCPIKLKRVHEGIIVSDRCLGSNNASGLYKLLR